MYLVNGKKKKKKKVLTDQDLVYPTTACLVPVYAGVKKAFGVTPAKDIIIKLMKLSNH